MKSKMSLKELENISNLIDVFAEQGNDRIELPNKVLKKLGYSIYNENGKTIVDIIGLSELVHGLIESERNVKKEYER